MDIDVEQRAAQAESYFRQGYNCAQSVYMAFADLYGLDTETAAKIVAPLGGGMGRLREVCGACSGMFMVAGLHIPTTNPADHQTKARTYVAVQHLAARFKEENGSIICRELLGLSSHNDAPIPETRTDAYYKKRPCAELVHTAAYILATALKNNEL